MQVCVSVYSGSDELDEEVEADLGRSQEEEPVEPVGEETMGVEPMGVEPRVSLLKSEVTTLAHSSSKYATCVSEINGSLKAQQELDSESHAYLSAESLDPGRSEVSSASAFQALPSEHAQNVPSEMNGSTGQLPTTERSLGASGMLQATPQATPPHSDSSGQFTKFNNLLDKCDATDSDVVKPKPSRAVQSAFPQREHPQALVSPGGPPANQQQPPRMESTSQFSTSATTTISPAATVSGTIDHHEHTSSPEASPSPLDGLNEAAGPLQPFLFPVSNSPVDLVTMLSRLASFTGELLTVLTPKIRKTGFTRDTNKVCKNAAIDIIAISY